MISFFLFLLFDIIQQKGDSPYWRASYSNIEDSNTKQHFYYRMKNPTFTIEYKTLVDKMKGNALKRNQTFCVEEKSLTSTQWRFR